MDSPIKWWFDIVSSSSYSNWTNQLGKFYRNSIRNNRLHCPMIESIKFWLAKCEIIDFRPDRIYWSFLSPPQKATFTPFRHADHMLKFFLLSMQGSRIQGGILKSQLTGQHLNHEIFSFPSTPWFTDSPSICCVSKKRGWTPLCRLVFAQRPNCAWITATEIRYDLGQFRHFIKEIYTFRHFLYKRPSWPLGPTILLNKY